jgi:hypothetical protein
VTEQRALDVAWAEWLQQPVWGRDPDAGRHIDDLLNRLRLGCSVERLIDVLIGKNAFCDTKMLRIVRFSEAEGAIEKLRAEGRHVRGEEVAERPDRVQLIELFPKPSLRDLCERGCVGRLWLVSQLEDICRFHLRPPGCPQADVVGGLQLGRAIFMHALLFGEAPPAPSAPPKPAVPAPAAPELAASKRGRLSKLRQEQLDLSAAVIDE